MEEELRKRLDLIVKAKDNPELQGIEIQTCKLDILYWFKNYAVTDKNNTLYGADMPDVLPFIPYEFQEEMILEIWDSICK